MPVQVYARIKPTGTPTESEQRTFDRWLSAIHPTLVDYVRRRSRATRLSADDAVSDAVFRVVRAYRAGIVVFANESHLAKYLQIACTNRLRDEARVISRQEQFLPTLSTDVPIDTDSPESCGYDYPDPTADPLYILTKSCWDPQLDNACLSLHPSARASLRSYYVMGMTKREIAELEGVTVATITHRIRRAIRNIRRIVGVEV